MMTVEERASFDRYRVGFYICLCGILVTWAYWLTRPADRWPEAVSTCEQIKAASYFLEPLENGEGGRLGEALEELMKLEKEHCSAT